MSIKILNKFLGKKSTEEILSDQEGQLAVPVDLSLNPLGRNTGLEKAERISEELMQIVTDLTEVGKKLKEPKSDFFSIDLLSPSELADNDQWRVGFDTLDAIDTLQKEKVIKNFKVIKSGVYKADVSYKQLLSFAESLHDEIEGVGNVYSEELQKKTVLQCIKEILDEDKKADFDDGSGILTISEAILGSYEKQNPTDDPAGISLLRPDKNRPDIKYKFMHVLRLLERERYFTINNVKIDFASKPTVTSKSQKSIIFGGDLQEYYPPRHCEVTITLPPRAFVYVDGFNTQKAMKSHTRNINPNTVEKKPLQVQESQNKKSSDVSQSPIPSEEIYSFGCLELNITKATLKFRDNPQINIRPSTRGIKLLRLLLINKEAVTTYDDVKAKIPSNSFQSEDSNRATQYIMDDLKPILRNAKMTNDEINIMFFNIPNIGYKLVALPQK